MFGPSGGGVWNAPTIDPRRNALYVGTGNNYSRPVTPTSDAVMAMDLDSGKVLWTQQALAEDAWIPACAAGAPLSGNCPEHIGPDYDFGASPILKSLASGRRLLLAVAKSGIAWAMDPDKAGAVVWKTPPPKAAAGPEGEMVWGAAADDRHLYVGLTSGGVAAYRLDTGEVAWTTPIAPSETSRRAGHSGAVTATPGMVFSGGWDGVLRAIEADSGRVVWAHQVPPSRAGWCSSGPVTSACATARLGTSCWRSARQAADRAARQAAVTTRVRHGPAVGANRRQRCCKGSRRSLLGAT
jgi:polyvinyl alcohol dehydrogenase (cytochrome)